MQTEMTIRPITTWRVSECGTFVELYFAKNQDRALVEALGSFRWRWHAKRKCWYAVRTKQNEEIARHFCQYDEAAA